MKVIVEMSGKDGKVKVGIDADGECSTTSGYTSIVNESVSDAIKAYKELKDEVEK